MPKPFTPPRLVNADASLTAILSGLQERYTAIFADANLSETGKVAQFSREAAGAIKRLEGRRPLLAQKRRELEAKLDKLGALALAGAEATPAEEQAFLALWAAARTEPKVRERLLRRLADEADVTTETQKLRRYSLTLPDELTNIAHARPLIELRLRPSLPAEAAALANAAAAVEQEARHVEQALDAIAAAASRDVLEAEGAVGPRIATWTPEQRAEFATKYGVEALGAAIARESLIGGDESRTREVAPDAQKVASADMAAFFSEIGADAVPAS